MAYHQELTNLLTVSNIEEQESAGWPQAAAPVLVGYKENSLSIISGILSVLSCFNVSAVFS